MSAIIKEYKHPVLFYSLATFIPWLFWIIAGYISHLSPETSTNENIASILGLIGLLAPMSAAFWFIYKDTALKNDFFARLVNFKSFKPFIIIMKWLYYKTGRNIIVPIIFHITAGYFNEIFATHPDSKIIQTMILLILAILLLIKEKEFFFIKNPAST